MAQSQTTDVKLIDRVTVSPADAGILLGVSRPIVYDLMRREYNPLPHFAIGKRVLIPVAPMVEWAKEQSGVE